jgi:hypothetical protein
MLAIDSPYPQFFDLDGRPLDAGYVYIGAENQNPETAPITVYWDRELTQPASQPLRTMNGMLARNGTPAFVYTAGSYSMVVRTAKKRQIIYARSAQEFSIGAQLAGASGAGIVGFNPSGIGATPTTVQAALNQFDHKPTGQFYSNLGARIDRLSDRLFVGAATVNDGTTTQTVNDWLSIYQNSIHRPGGPAMCFATLGVLNSESSSAPNVFVSGVQQKDFPNGTSGIAISGFAVNNNPTAPASGSFSGYFEAVRTATGAGGAYGIEIDIANYGPVSQIDPYLQQGGQTIALQLAAGAEFPATGEQNASSAAINIRDNNATFARGIVFGANSLEGVQNNVGTAPAIIFGVGHTISWMSGHDVFTSSISCQSLDRATALSQTFGANAVVFVNAADKTVFQVAQYPNSVNYLSARSNAAGLPTQLYADGDDTNVDIQLVPKGAGVVWLGNYTAGALSPSGYITVKDAAGNVRRLLVG